jgi:hypothetical protein
MSDMLTDAPSMHQTREVDRYLASKIPSGSPVSALIFNLYIVFLNNGPQESAIPKVSLSAYRGLRCNYKGKSMPDAWMTVRLARTVKMLQTLGATFYWHFLDVFSYAILVTCFSWLTSKCDNHSAVFFPTLDLIFKNMLTNVLGFSIRISIRIFKTSLYWKLQS